jgi:acyl carrier protein
MVSCIVAIETEFGIEIPDDNMVELMEDFSNIVNHVQLRTSRLGAESSS